MGKPGKKGWVRDYYIAKADNMAAIPSELHAPSRFIADITSFAIRQGVYFIMGSAECTVGSRGCSWGRER